METQFEEVIATRERLREISKQPSDRASDKIIDHMDDICRRFIYRCRQASLVDFRTNRSADIDQTATAKLD